MKLPFSNEIEQARIVENANGWETPHKTPFGVFVFRYRRKQLRVIVAPEYKGWEHVSVSCDNSKYPPSWDEMCFIKGLFWDGSECVVQFHPPKSKYVNFHPGVLHLWKQCNSEFPMPPIECV